METKIFSDLVHECKTITKDVEFSGKTIDITLYGIEKLNLSWELRGWNIIPSKLETLFSPPFQQI